MTAIHTPLTLTPKPVAVPPLVEQLKGGLDAPICLTWELTYACNLACVHCLSSSGRRDPKELTTAEALAVVDELADLQVFYVNLGGGEPMIRKDFLDLVDHAVGRNVGVKFSTNGYYIDQQAAERFAATDLLDIQISLDGFDAATNDAVRGPGSWEAARRAMDNLAAANFGEFKISIVATRHNVAQLDDYKKMADEYGAQLRVTRLRPSGRGVDVLTGDSFFHLNALGTNTGETLPGLSMCGAGRIVCLIDPIGDVYACPFVIHDEFMAGNVRDAGGFASVWRESELFAELRQPGAAGACASCNAYDACGGGCMAAKFFTGIPLDGPDPDCVLGHADEAVAAANAAGIVPQPSQDHSRPVRIGARPS